MKLTKDQCTESLYGFWLYEGSITTEEDFECDFGLKVGGSLEVGGRLKVGGWLEVGGWL